MKTLNTQDPHSFIPRFNRDRIVVCFCLSLLLLSSSCGELIELNIDTACIESPTETLDENLRRIQPEDQIAGYWHLRVDQIDAICSENQDSDNQNSENQDSKSQQRIVAIDSALIIIETYDNSIWLEMWRIRSAHGAMSRGGRSSLPTTSGNPYFHSLVCHIPTAPST